METRKANKTKGPKKDINKGNKYKDIKAKVAELKSHLRLFSPSNPERVMVTMMMTQMRQTMPGICLGDAKRRSRRKNDSFPLYPV